MTPFRPVLRSLLRAPGFALPAVLTLALGIGANTGAFSALRELVWNPLPYPNSGRLAALYETAADGKPRGVAEANLLDWRRSTPLIESMAAYQPRSFGLTLRDGAPVTVIQTGMTMAAFFPVLAVPPALGRAFSEQEEASEAHLMVLTNRLWRRSFGSDRTVLGRKVFLNEDPFTVIGVMPAGFEYPIGGVLPDAFIPLSRRDYCCGRLGSQEAIARLAPGAGLEAARAQLEAAAAGLARQYPATNGGRSAGLRPLAETVAGPRREPLFLLTAAALALLLIACANVAGLVLARGLGRTREMAIRASLGAGPAEWVAPFLVEAAALAVAGSIAGMAAAALVLRAVPAFLPGAVPPHPPALDTAAFLFAFLLASGVALVLGAAPAWLLGRADLTPLLKSGGRAAVGGSAGLRNALVVAQVALSVVLLLGAAVLLRSLLRLTAVNPGFETAHALRFGIGLPEKRYDTGRKLIDFHHALIEQLAALPGVRSVGAASRLPLRGGSAGPASSFQIAGANLPVPQRPRAWINSASPGYFEAMGIPLIEGRGFSWRDDQPGRRRVVVVNRTFARTYLQGRRPIGTLLESSWTSELNPPGSAWEIIGVAGDTHRSDLDRQPVPEIFLSWSQTGADGGVYVIRTAGGETGLPRAIAQTVQRADPRLERISVTPLELVVDRNLESRRATIQLVGGFGALALLLAGLGIYGMVAFRAAERQREMAIRVALGATAAQVRGLVFGHGLRLAAVGAVLGVAAFIPASRLLEAQVYGVSTADPFSMAVAAALAVAAAAAASAGPSFRASRKAPMDLLREG
ncbi:MAG TPA: ADOP family duplicated permease [Bryobacteraceae bacterium]|nr:ADOP family duplicated permease [Bryobacteraceae bacterium]